MTLVSNHIIVPQHLEYLIVDRDLVICEHSSDIVRFFLANGNLSIGQNLQDIFPEIKDYQQKIENILKGKERYFSLPKILFRTHQNVQRDRWQNSALLASEVHFKLHFTQYSQNESNYLVVFLEEVTNYNTSILSLLPRTNEYKLLHDVSQLSKELANSVYFYESIFASIEEALIITNNRGIIQQINQGTINLLSYSEAELLDRSINMVIADPNFLLSEIQQYLLSQGELLKNLEVICKTKQGIKKIISFTCSSIKVDINKNSHDERLVYFGRDITNLKNYQQRQNIQFSISKILASSLDLKQAAPKILRVICENLNLTIGEIWIKSQQILPQEIDSQPENLGGDLLKCEFVWSKNSQQINESIEITQKKEYRLFEDIVGDIWLNNSFKWYDNCLAKSTYYRQKIARKLGLLGGFGLPVQGEDGTLAVLNFWSERENELEQSIVDLMQTIANQLGQFIQRKRAEQALKYQQEKSEKLLLNIFPKIIAEQLKKQSSTIANHFDSVTILFADLVNFTNLFSQLPPIEIVEILNEIFSEFDRISSKYNLEKIKIIGDAYMVVGGLPQPRKDHAEAIAEMALDMQEAIAQFNRETDKTLSLRIGINTGAVVAGVIGTKKLSYDLWGDAVNIACRMESHGIPNYIQVTASTYEILKDKYIWQSRGKIHIKGKGEMSTYFLLGRKPE
ncbi:MAG: adenylate/guanylate cyclase domain-containing protein [Xenococcaceae cyanobacterium]